MQINEHLNEEKNEIGIHLLGKANVREEHNTIE